MKIKIPCVVFWIVSSNILVVIGVQGRHGVPPSQKV